jgi:hypothetical protein
MVPASLSLAGRVVWSLTGDLGTSSISLAVLVLATLVELAFVGAVAGVGVRRVLDSHFPGQSAWFGCFLIYVACHIFSSALVTSQTCNQCNPVSWFDRLEARSAQANCEQWRPTLSRDSAFGARERLRA